MSIASIASIAAASAAGTLAMQSHAWLDAAAHEIAFARDPRHLGDEPHLRYEADPCGLEDDDLQRLEQSVWGELARREDLRRAKLPTRLRELPFRLAA